MLYEPWIRPELLHRLKMPVLVVAGSDDMIRECHTRQIACSLPNARIRLLEGTHFIVKIKENDLAVEEEAEDDKENWPGSNLVATQDGVVVSILTRQGVPKVTEGTSVQKGDILVSGAVPVMADDGTVREYQFCHADADIFLKTSYEYEDRIALTRKEKQYTGKKKREYLSLIHI